MSVLLPVNISLQDWADSLVLENPGIPRLDAEEDWQRWATEIVIFSDFRSYNPPRPDAFLVWRDWAYEFTKAVN